MRFRAMKLAAVLLWCGTLLGAGQASAQGLVIRYGYQTTLWGAPSMVAFHDHVWRKLGLKVVPVALSSGKAVRDALLAGSVDIGSIGATPLIVGAAKSSVVAIGVGGYAGDTLSLVASAKSGITKVSQLKGKRIASQIGSTTDYTLRSKVLPAFGLNDKQVHLVNVRFGDMVAALASGSVDAFAGVEPYNALAVHQHLGRVLVTFGKYDMAPFFLGSSAGFVDAHPEAVKKFLRGWKEVAELFRKDPDQVAGLVGAAFHKRGWKVPKVVLRTSLSEMTVATGYRPDLRAYLTAQAKALIHRGVISSVPDWSKVLR